MLLLIDEVELIEDRGDQLLTEGDIELINEPQIGIIAANRSGKGPQLTPVWVDTDGTAVIFNTSKGRIKEKLIAADPNVSICVVDNKNPFRWVNVTGTAELIEDGADDHINRLAKKYLGVDEYPYRQEGEERVMVRITPTSRTGA
ncbi:MAG: PPOX class F420-dependent oxidoreductase [Actinomycetota bacterium]|nr:PPOX class F420-dependent oxidoreductase [Actinomycetota bacterium]